MPKFQAKQGRSQAAQKASKYFDTMAALKAENTPESRKQIKKLLDTNFHSAPAGPGSFWKKKAKSRQSIDRDYSGIESNPKRSARWA